MKIHPVEVEWEDAASSGGWATKESYMLSPVICKTTGYLLQKNKKYLVVVQSEDQNGKVNDAITIPMKCVKKIRRLYPKVKR